MSSKEISDKMIKMHAIMVLSVCVIFGIVSLARKAFLMGLCTVGMGVIIPVICLNFMKNSSKIKKGTFLTQASTIVIVVLSAAQGELHSMFALLAGNIAIGSVYYDLQNIKHTWILTDIITVGACLFKNWFYVGASFSLIIKGILGLNIAAFMVMFLLKDCIAHIDSAMQATEKADALLEQVQHQMDESKIMAEKQQRTVNRVSNIARHLDSSSGAMLDIANKITSSTEEQAATMEDIHESIQRFATQTSACYDASIDAKEAVAKSVEMLMENNDTMEKMGKAMEHLTETSMRIGSIIKTIDDISFQTNILALNAAVEAARAGAAGKGFAVVADEVRNLAGKSAVAAQNTEELIRASISAVEEGAQFARTVSENITDILNCSKESVTHTERIAQLTQAQQEDVQTITERISNINNIIAANTDTASESAGMANALSENVEQMNAIITAQ